MTFCPDKKFIPRGLDGAIYLVRFRDLNENNYALTPYESQLDEFLDELMPRASELYLLSHTWDPYSDDSKAELEKIQDDYLRNNSGITLEQLKGKLPEVYSYGSYAKRPRHEARTDFFKSIDLVLGSLASMNRDLGLFKDEFFRELDKRKIFPANIGGTNEIFNFLRNKL